LLPPIWLLKPIPPPRLLENPRWKLFPMPERKKEYGTNTVKSQRYTNTRHFFVMNIKARGILTFQQKLLHLEHFSSIKTVKNK